MSNKEQPVNSVEWVKVEKLSANDYNPNHVAPPELQLLKTSILKSGWTQPIVINKAYEIIDGFHRWLLASKDKDVQNMTDGKVPTVMIKEIDREEQMMSTVRHNRARGKHAVLKMSDLVRELIDERGMSEDEVGNLLQMEYEEIERLYDDTGMINRGSEDDFNKGWVPTEKQ